LQKEENPPLLHPSELTNSAKRVDPDGSAHNPNEGQGPYGIRRLRGCALPTVGPQPISLQECQAFGVLDLQSHPNKEWVHLQYSFKYARHVRSIVDYVTSAA
jgi:hypothetical protein